MPPHELYETMHDELFVSQQGRVGRIVLNRPKALNALTLSMVQSMDRVLRQWIDDDSVQTVVVTGQGDRAFCAGGDVKSVYFAGKQGDVGRPGTLTADFFRHEYRLNHLIANYPKPYVAYIDGITMGGGVGVSVLGSHCIASQHTRLAMPETAIGFFPDVGGSYFLSRLGPLGTLLALTGETIDFSTTLDLGFAKHYVPREKASEFLKALLEQPVQDAIESYAQTYPPSERTPVLKQVADRCFDSDQLEEIIERLEQTANESSDESSRQALSHLARNLLETLRRRSPTSMKVTLEQLKRGRSMTLEECLIMEYRISQACMKGHDFYEGIRAVLVDKDHAPNWSPSKIEAVDDALVQKHFQPLGDDELTF